MTSTKRQEDEDQSAQAGSAVYVYGVVPGDVEVEDDAKGIGDPPGKVEIIREGDIAALVSTVPIDRPLGKPADLQAHAALLDGTASVAPVLPLRFGAVMTDVESVASELLREHHDEFAQTLHALEGHAEYIVKGRYQEESFLSDLLSENDQARQLREDIQAKPEAAARNSRMALGELIANTIEAARQSDTQRVVEELKGMAEQVNVREPTHEWDAVHVAVLAKVDREADLQELVERLNESARGRTELRIVGPVAAYDFVMTAEPEA
jgi:Gas vesicle synthesis protein GvpL/GvpF